MSLKKNYVITEEIGSGSMANIHKAIQKSLERVVAIKRIHPHLSQNMDFVRRFEREAKASANLKHINILDIIDFGRDEDGSHYIVMEFIDGPTILEIVKGADKLPLDLVFSMTIQLLNGLEHAHNNGVVHRDIKPANLMMMSSGVVKITDFGIAQAAKLPSLTQAGQRMGTPSYMSPEQARGEDLDHRSDLFSVGIVLFELVTSLLPFKGNTLSLINQIANDPLPSIESISPDVPKPLVKVIEKALEKDVARRMFDAAEFAYELETVALELGIRFGPRVCKDYLEKSFGLSEDAKDADKLTPSEIRRISPSTGVGKNRPTAGILPLQGCFGCQLNMLDLHEKFVEIHKMLDVKFSYLMDIKEPPELDIGIVEGCVANSENVERLQAFREKCGLLVALGTCACFGGVPGLRNLFPVNTVINRAYSQSESTIDGGSLPDPSFVPSLTKHVQIVADVVEVDASIPGCPSPPELVLSSLKNLVAGTKARIPTHNLCYECRRKHKEMLNPQRKFISDEINPIMELDEIDPDVCFLEQGVLCLGLATREGCGARCLGHNVPCQGCMGPAPKVRETGAKWIDALGSLLPGGALRFRHDVVGSGYRYTLPISMMPFRKD
jgi:serine/threonine protein kinase